VIIYLEGPDASGKSTLRDRLAKELVNQLETIRALGITEIVKNGEDLIPTRPTNPKRLTFEPLLRKLCEMASDLHVLYLCDRGPISDVIYRTFDKHQPIMTLNQYLIVSLDTVILFSLFIAILKYHKSY